jgi:hypothetical protein
MVGVNPRMRSNCATADSPAAGQCGVPGLCHPTPAPDGKEEEEITDPDTGQRS